MPTYITQRSGGAGVQAPLSYIVSMLSAQATRDTHAHLHTYMHTHTHVHTCMFMYSYVHIVHTCTPTYIHMHTWVRLRNEQFSKTWP